MIQPRMLPLEKIEKGPVIQARHNDYEMVIPWEILNFIFPKLTSETLASCDLVCKDWHALTDHRDVNNKLWNQVIAKEIRDHAFLSLAKKSGLNISEK